MSETAEAPGAARIWRVVRRNPEYRRLFAANAVSQIGDWLDVVALFSLLVELTGRGESIAFVLVARTLPFLFAGPLAGVLADRWSRRAILVACDVLRAGLVLCLLFVRRPDQAWIAYTVVVLHATLTAFFDPAQQATFPDLVKRDDLVVASALDNSLWSVMLAVGSAVGALVMATAGRNAAFLVDSASFLGSAWLLRGLPERVARPATREPPPHPGAAPSATPHWTQTLGLRDFKDGLRYIAGHHRVRSIIVAKAGFGLTLGGVLTLLPFFGEKVFAHPGRAGTGIALLYTARGVGSFVGPFAAWALGGDSERALRRGMLVAFGLLIVCYGAFAASPALAFAAGALAVANAGGSILWTYGSSLLALILPGEYRGRVYAAEGALMTLAMAVTTIAVGRALDAGASPRLLMALCGAVALVPIAFWAQAQRHFTADQPPA